MGADGVLAAEKDCCWQAKEMRPIPMSASAQEVVACSPCDGKRRDGHLPLCASNMHLIVKSEFTITPLALFTSSHMEQCVSKATTRTGMSLSMLGMSVGPNLVSSTVLST